ncbi:AAA family ATPase [Microcoleus sp. FACHB-1515]|uniref:AAA family ATPase n=1 Tax=Cyanophyceae TaxID=3028117 RepID=UPI0016865862|nr:AAA family ATPase [Microcoleus sp. FACHB-1515]MBD2088366.1 AAA family ATPase [Microcoleus sp. FACHB-1515]
MGTPKPQQIPAALAAPSPAAKSLTISPQKMLASHQELMKSNGPAKQWLHQRGITDEIIARYQLGFARSKVGDRHLPSIAIPLPANDDGTAYHQKKRVAPWLSESDRPRDYRAWSQAGIPARVWFTWRPVEAEQTFLCEGEWDAMLLGWQMRHADLPIAVACFTCGCGTVPPLEQLDKLPGTVSIFYDRNDKPDKHGKIPGEEGAKKVAEALGDRARIAAVPMPDNCQSHGWDISDALNGGFTLQDIIHAANSATIAVKPLQKPNKLRDRLKWNDELLDSAPDYTEWLVPDLLTADELFLLAAGPRAGKSLMAMTLARAVAAGDTFLDRPVTQGTVMYVRCEDGEAKTKERELAQGWTRGLPVAWFDKFKLSEIDQLRELAKELDPRLIVLDTLSRIRDGSISESSAEMSQALEPLQELAQEIGCCVLLVHHTNKVSAENAGTIDVFDTIRGSSSIRAVCRGSLIIAAGERNFRLCVENGWGKHDLSILLDANTLTWRLLGQWQPVIVGDQKERVVEYLKQVQRSSLDDIHIATQIPKKSLYEVLARLQTVDAADDRVIKEGTRRNYTYRLALFNTIQLLNTLLNSANPDSDSDTGHYSTKNDFSLNTPKVISDHIGTCDSLITFDPLPEREIVEYSHEQASNADTASISAFQQQFNSIQQESQNADTASLPPIQQKNQGDHSAIQQGDCVEIRSGQFWGKLVTVESVEGDLVRVKGEGWHITRTYAIAQVKFVSRGGDRDG